ncbi:hypothetical protein MBLNU459_g5696t1 [Dothideomycetes sp. NU459]
MSTPSPQHPTWTQPYYDRAALPNTSPVSAYLLRLIAIKKTNLCVSADVTTTKELLQLAEDVGDSICLLKTHADIISDFGPRTMQGLKEIATKKHFLIFEDRKFGDIGSTVQKQFTAGPLQIVRWANIVNAHIFPGPAIVTALSQAASGAVAALNTAVTTSISASPVPSYLDDSDGRGSPALSSTANDYEEGEEEEGEDGDDDDDDVDEEDLGDGDEDERTESPSQLRKVTSNDDKPTRKTSVVSISTTISTKTESISPQPGQSHHHNPSVPNSPVNTRHFEEPSAAALAGLGEPPFLRALLLLAEMSSKDNLMTGSYTAQCLVEARKDPSFVMGFIAQRSLNQEPGDNFITMTPGVQIGSSGDGLGQQYNTPEKVVGEGGTDVIIVGRGILAAQNRRAAAEQYRTRAWKAYEARVSQSSTLPSR